MTSFQEKTNIEDTVAVNPALIRARALIRKVNPVKSWLATGPIKKLWSIFGMGNHQYIDQYYRTPGHKGVLDVPSLSISAAVMVRTK